VLPVLLAVAMVEVVPWTVSLDAISVDIAGLRAALQRLEQKLLAVKAAGKDAKSKGNAPQGAPSTDTSLPWNWTIFNILNGPTAGLAGGAGSGGG